MSQTTISRGNNTLGHVLLSSDNATTFSSWPDLRSSEDVAVAAVYFGLLLCALLCCAVSFMPSTRPVRGRGTVDVSSYYSSYEGGASEVGGSGRDMRFNQGSKGGGGSEILGQGAANMHVAGGLLMAGAGAAGQAGGGGALSQQAQSARFFHSSTSTDAG